jgi:membrane fusion protein (multidrug efflux system)
VSVIRVATAPVTVYNEYVGQTQAPSTIEIRAQVTGLLERQAFDDGARVNRGDLLYVIDARPFASQLDQAKANLAQAQANLGNAETTLQRYERLIARHAVSLQDYDNAVAQEKSARAGVQAQRALVRDAELNVGYTRIRAPREGFMSNSLVHPGALITAQQTLLDTLYSSDPMWVNFTISEDRLLELQKRLRHPPGEDPQRAPPFRIKLADGTEYNLAGKLDFVDAALDPRNGTLQVRISVPNPKRVLRPNLFVRVVVPSYQDADAIRIPQQSVQELQGLKTVYVVATDGKVQQREISASYRSGNDWVVQGGLKPGELVVVEGLTKVKPGAPVKAVVAQSPATPSGGAEASADTPAPSTPEPASAGKTAQPGPAPPTRNPAAENASATR